MGKPCWSQESWKLLLVACQTFKSWCSCLRLPLPLRMRQNHHFHCLPFRAWEARSELRGRMLGMLPVLSSCMLVVKGAVKARTTVSCIPSRQLVVRLTPRALSSSDRVESLAPTLSRTSPPSASHAPACVRTYCGVLPSFPRLSPFWYLLSSRAWRWPRP